MAMVVVLFAAEWWRRNYDGGPWAWRLIFDALDSEAPDVQALYPVIETGLRGWRREILLVGGNRGFIATVACEGGLPLNLVRREGAKLRGFFRSLMSDINRFQGADISAEDLAEQSQHYLPASFRQQSVFELTARLAAVVLDFQGRIPEGHQDPLSLLDERVPAWRDELPLAIQDENAEAFLKGLVRDARAAARKHADRIKVVRRLLRQGDEYKLIADLEFPTSLPLDEFAAHFDEGIEQLGKRFELAIQCGEEAPVVCAWATRIGDGEAAQIRLDTLRGSKPRYEGVAAAGGIALVALAGTARLDSVAVTGGAALSDLPWTFRPLGEEATEAVFFGEGSVRARDPRVWVALTPDMQISDDHQGDSGIVIAELGRLVIPFSQHTTITMPTGETCRVAPAADADSGSSFRLRGAMRPMGAKGGFVYLGFPELIEDVEGRLARSVPSHEIEWASTLETGQWSSVSKKSVGIGYIRWVVDGELRYRGKICVLPADFAVHVDDAIDQKSGVISVAGLANTMILSTDAGGVKVSEVHEGHDEGRQFRISCDSDDVPATCTLYVRWPHDCDCEIQVPFPGRGARFFSASGKLIASGSWLTLDQLIGARAVAASPHSFDRFDLVFRLVSSDVGRSLAASARAWRRLDRVRGQTKEWAYDLRRIRRACESLLSVTKDLDAFVEVKIEGSGQTDSSCVRVRRFEFSLDRDDTAIWITDEDLKAFEDSELPELRMSLRPIITPEEPCVELVQRVSEDQATGQWPIDANIVGREPMLAVCSVGDWHRFRPLLVDLSEPVIAAEGEEPTDTVPTLAECLKIPVRHERREALERRVIAMSESPLDSDWAYVNAIYAKFSDLPPSTLDLFAAIDRVPLAAATFLLSGKASEFRERVEFLEGLPVLSHLVPLKAWVKAAEITKAVVEQQHGADTARLVIDQRKGLFPDDGERWSLVADVFAWAADGYIKPGSNLSFASVAAEQLAQVLKYEVQLLLQRHAEVHWPQGPALRDWFRAHAYEMPDVLRTFWIPSPGNLDHQEPLINAPVCAALISATGAKCPEPMLLELRLLRDFDPDWFRYAYCNVLLRAIGVLGLESFSDESRTD